MQDGPSALGRADARLRSELGMPFVPTVFALLGRHDRYLVAAMEAFVTPSLDTIEEHARMTRAIGSEAAAALVRTPLRAGSAGQAILELLDRYNEVNPRSLLVTTPLAHGLTLASRVMEQPLPPSSAGGGADSLLADVQACHGAFNVPGLWRELAAGWPEHAGAAWSLVRGLPRSEDFARARDAVLSLARATVAGRTGPRPADVSCAADEALEITQVLAWYQIVIPTMVVEIECLRRAFALGAETVEE